MRTLILGGPGCGKTYRLLNLVEDAIKEGVPPERIAFMSFSRAAANEAKERAIKKFNLGQNRFPHFRTLHSMAYRDAGLSTEMVMTGDNYKELGKLCAMDFKGAYKDEEFMLYGTGDGDKMKFIEEQARIRKIDPEKILLEYPDVDAFQFRKYRRALKEYKHANDLFDFTDMLGKYAFDGLPLNVDVFIIDEAQDLSLLQWNVAERAVQKANKVFFAGDDDQAIHAWCGADVHYFRNLEVDGIERLTQSHRMTRSVHKKSLTLLEKIGDRYEKEWVPRDEEGSVKLIDEVYKIDYSKGTWLLLARNSCFLHRYEQALESLGWHYSKVGQKAPISKYVDPIYGWERLRKGDLLSVAEIKKIYAWMSVGKGVARGHKSMQGADVERKYGLIDLKKEHGLLVDCGWEEALDKIPYQKKAYIISCRKNGERLLEEPRIKIGTIHSVKGAEADNVVLMPDMAWPTYREWTKGGWDNEARVFYVGVTRARHNLFITTPSGNNFYPL